MPRKHAPVLLLLYACASALLAGSASALWLGCASVAGRPLAHDPVHAAPDAISFCKGWERALHGNLSYISSTPDGSRLAVSTSADDGRPRSIEARMRVFNAKGKIIWSRWLGQPVKGQAISADGSLVAVSTYEDLLYLFNAAGKLLWTKALLGTPVILSKTGRVLLLNDDDSDPETAFVTYDRAGREIGKARVALNAEPFDISVSEDETLVAFALNPKTWQARTFDGKLVAEGSLSGDAAAVTAFSAANGPVKAVYVLYSSGGRAQRLAGFEIPSGRALWDIALDRHYLALRALDEKGRAVLVLYGNGRNGQALASYDGASGRELWKRAYSLSANDSSPIFVAPKFRGFPALATAVINAGAEADGGKFGILHALGITASGNAAFDVALDAPDGVFWYAYASSAPALAAGAGEAGDAVLYYFRKCK